MKKFPIFTVRDPELSRWQSTIEEMVAEKHPTLSTKQLRCTPIVQGCWLYVKNTMEGKAVPEPTGDFDENNIEHQAFLSAKLHAAVKEAHKNNMPADTELDPNAPTFRYRDRSFSDSAIMRWVFSGIFTHYLNPLGNTQSYNYRGFKNPAFGNGNIDFGVIDWKLPSYAKIAIIGDWGTGNEDAEQFLKKLVAQERIDCIIHLGDVYYSGTKRECKKYFYDVIRDKCGLDVPVFTIPGNHEYYSYCRGFDYLIDNINNDIPIKNAQQKATYFCLKDVDDRFQFLGLDTGYHDHDPTVTFIEDPAPGLRDINDYIWARDKIEKFPGKTILLTHHQVFSRSADLKSHDYGKSYGNPHLIKHFSEMFGDKVVAWYWGHEHSFALFKEGAFGLNCGRLLGSSSYEVAKSPYDDKYPMVAYSSNNKLPTKSTSTFNTAQSYEFYPHVGAIMDLNPNGQHLKVNYYSFPAWPNNHPPTNPQMRPLTSETIANPKPRPIGVWKGDYHLDDDHFRSSRAPALAYADGKLFMVYKNTADDYRLWWDILDVDVETGQMRSNNPQRLNSDDSKANTRSYPSMVQYGRKLFLVYKDLDDSDLKWYTYDLDDQEWEKHGKVEDDGDEIQSHHGVRLTVFQNKIHMFYLEKSNDKTIRWATYDGDEWKDQGQLNNNGYQVYSHHEVCPVVAANDENLFILYSPHDDYHNIALMRIDSEGSLHDMDYITNDGCSPFNEYLPVTTETFAACADNKYLRILYRSSKDDGKYICWAVLDLGQYETNGNFHYYDLDAGDVGTWSGGLPIIAIREEKDEDTGVMKIVHHSRPDTQSFPGYCMGGGYSFIVYPDKNDEEFSTAVQKN